MTIDIDRLNLREINLLHEYSFSDLRSRLLKETRDEIERRDRNYILSVNETEYKNYLLKEKQIEPLSIFPENWSVQDAERSFESRYSDTPQKVQVFIFFIPFSGPTYLFEYQPSHFIISCIKARIYEKNLVITISNLSNDSRKILNDVKDKVNDIQKNISNLNEDIDQYNQDLRRCFHKSPLILRICGYNFIYNS